MASKPVCDFCGIEGEPIKYPVCRLPSWQAIMVSSVGHGGSRQVDACPLCAKGLGFQEMKYVAPVEEVLMGALRDLIAEEIGADSNLAAGPSK